MASTLSFSEISMDNNNEEKISQKRRKNKTIKKKSHKVREFLNSMESEEEETDGLADFTPPPQPELTRQPDPIKENELATDTAIGPEAFTKLDTNQASNLNYQNYYNTYVPYYSKASNNANIHGSKDELMKKLNYMIHLLEENKDEKTQNVTEELVLYMFLGVFTIFVVDSFARAGKYTR